MYPNSFQFLVNIPGAGRFAIHKLVISQRRATRFAAKSVKDIDQARQVIEVLLDVRPGALSAALDAGENMGEKFMRHYRSAVSLLPKSLQEALVEVV